MIDTLALVQPYLHIVVAALLPVLIAMVAGAIRQDGLPDSANEVISYGAVVGVGVIQALTDGKLGGSPLADFMLVSGYSQAALHSPLLQSLQKYLQVNVFNFIKAPSPVPAASQSIAPADPAASLFDLFVKNAPNIAQLVGVELSKQLAAQSQSQSVVAPPPYQAPAPVAQSGKVSPGYTGGSTIGVPTHVDEIQTQNGLAVVRVNTPPANPFIPNRGG